VHVIGSILRLPNKRNRRDQSKTGLRMIRSKLLASLSLRLATFDFDLNHFSRLSRELQFASGGGHGVDDGEGKNAPTGSKRCDVARDGGNVGRYAAT
jgi:hypothetical protein